MPSQNYTDNQNSTLRLDSLKQARAAYDSGTEKAAKRFDSPPKHSSLSEEEKGDTQKEMKNKLSSLQRTAPKTLSGIKKGRKKAIAGFVFRLFSQIDITTDWPFILLFSFALLKDIFDIVFAAAGTAAGGILNIIPIAGQIASVTMAAIGMTMSFVGELLFLTLTVTVLVLVGSSLKNRGMAKYFLGIGMEFIAEALPGINWLPWTVVYVIVLYGCVLYDRAYSRQAELAETTSENENDNIQIPQSGTAADNYLSEDQKIAA